MKIKAIMFDLDNTLIDFMGMKRRCIEAAVDAMIDAGLNMKKVDAVKKIYKIYDVYGIEYQKIFDDFLRENLGRVDYRIMGAGIAAYRKTKLIYLEPYPHVIGTLTKLSKVGTKLAIISDAPRLQVWTRLASLKLHHIFDVVVTLDDTGKTKESGLPFKFCLEKLKLKPEDCLMVGDWVERDIVGAKKFGIKTVFARYGDIFNTKKSGADWEIKDIKELINIVKR